MGDARIKECCVLAVEHASVLGTQELQDFIREAIPLVTSNAPPSEVQKRLVEVKKREGRERAVIGRDGLRHDSTDRCLLRALAALLRMSMRTARTGDYFTVLEHCAAAADMCDQDQPCIGDGPLYLAERSYHNEVLNPLVAGHSLPTYGS